MTCARRADDGFEIRRSPRISAAGTVVLASISIAFVLALRDMRSVLLDDAAIAFRYAWRIAHGYGFTYNDGDRTNGASAPLYTLVLAGIGRLGVDLELGAKAIGASCFATSCGLVSWLGFRLGGGIDAAIAAPAFLLTMSQYRELALSGMESAFAVMLGLSVLCLLHAGRDVLAGVTLGLAVTNKLDAMALVVGVVAAAMVVGRRHALHLVISAAATAAPWFAFSTWYFGSPVPFSATQKAKVVANPAADHEPFWILRTLVSDYTLLLVAAAALSLALLPRLVRRDRQSGVVLVASATWAALHGLFFSVVNLGDAYPWYSAAIYPPVALGAAVLSVHYLRRSRRNESAATSSLAGASVLVVALTLSRVPHFVEIGRVAFRGHHVDAYEAFERTRRDAGSRLASRVSRGEVVETCFGWVAYGVPTASIRETCPLSTRKPTTRPTWGVEAWWPSNGDELLPPGTNVVEILRSSVNPVGRTVVYAYSERTSSS